jgi:hypothetical protein
MRHVEGKSNNHRKRAGTKAKRKAEAKRRQYNKEGDTGVVSITASCLDEKIRINN